MKVSIIGSQTYERPWVRYELLKSFKKGNHIFGVHINAIKCKGQSTKIKGPNPLEYVGVTFSDSGKTATLWENKNGKWIEYKKIDGSSSYRVDVAQKYRGEGFNLARFFDVYDWVADDGYNNFFYLGKLAMVATEKVRGEEELSEALSENSASVQAHLQITQNVIQRMAANSTSCKAWCITVVSAILVLIADKNKPELAWLALLPSFLFLSLDAYYLALEKAFRASYNNFIKKLHENKIFSEDLYSVIPKGSMSRHQLDAIRSFSVWGFYGTLILLVVVAKTTILV